MGTFDAIKVRKYAQDMRKDIVEMVTAAGSGHPGGSLSAADIVATLYFGGHLNYTVNSFSDPLRDRFILSKGHAAPVLYAALSQLGLIDHDELLTLRKLGSRLQGHPDSTRLVGVEVSTGSLGQGLSIAAGNALALHQQGGSQRVYTLLGDGELQEGQVWEAAMFASHKNLGNLIAFVDHNNLQIDGFCSDIMCLGSIESKFAAFGWKTISVDGHDVVAINDAINQAKEISTKPTVIVCKTVKGKGVSFMENQAGWHGKAPDLQQCKDALCELVMHEEAN